MRRLLLTALLLALPCFAVATDLPSRLPLPSGRPLRVAFVISSYATVIDFTGPWEVFQDADTGDKPAIQLYTVAPSHDVIRTSGNGGHGIAITPDYSFADAPEPDLVVVGAQSGGSGLSEWLQKVNADKKIVMSVCTGAFKVAAAGLLDGKQATTHHNFFDQLSQKFPKVKVVRNARYVQADPILYSAGGLTSGIDLALHMVAQYYGEDAAQHTADYMEYQGTAWKTNYRAVAPAGS